jgi:hypothetical protein
MDVGIMKWICRTKDNPDKEFKTRKEAIEWAKFNADGIYIVWKKKLQKSTLSKTSLLA